VSPTAPIKIRIIRKRNGLVQAFPSPVILTAGESFTIVNATSEDAVITFDTDVITPKSQGIGARKASAVFTAGAGPDYVEYDVLLKSGHCAEGNSKPGAIIDP
jgi:hypothetical protein